MSNPQLAELDASLQAIVRRAYDLGRGDALKRVADVLNADQPCDGRLALMAPDGDTGASEQAMNGAAVAEPTPWWAWPVR